MSEVQLSIAVPAYNEESTIVATVEAMVAASEPTGWTWEIVIADDASRDNTWMVLQNLAERFPGVRPVKNSGPGGYGMAVKAALAATRGQAVVVAMADGSDLPEDIVAYGRAILEEGYGCAFGTRFSNPERVQGYPPVKRVLNRLGNRLIAWAAGRAYDDYTNGFKGFRRDVLDSIQPLVSADFNLTIEMSIKAVQRGATFKVVPNGWRDREGGESKFNIVKLGPRYLMTILYCVLEDKIRHAGARPR